MIGRRTRRERATFWIRSALRSGAISPVAGVDRDQADGNRRQKRRSARGVSSSADRIRARAFTKKSTSRNAQTAVSIQSSQRDPPYQIDATSNPITRVIARNTARSQRITSRRLKVLSRRPEPHLQLLGLRLLIRPAIAVRRRDPPSRADLARASNASGARASRASPSTREPTPLFHLQRRHECLVGMIDETRRPMVSSGGIRRGDRLHEPSQLRSQNPLTCRASSTTVRVSISVAGPMRSARPSTLQAKLLGREKRVEELDHGGPLRLVRGTDGGQLTGLLAQLAGADAGTRLRALPPPSGEPPARTAAGAPTIRARPGGPGAPSVASSRSRAWRHSAAKKAPSSSQRRPWTPLGEAEIRGTFSPVRPDRSAAPGADPPRLELARLAGLGLRDCATVGRSLASDAARRLAIQGFPLPKELLSLSSGNERQDRVRMEPSQRRRALLGSLARSAPARRYAADRAHLHPSRTTTDGARRPAPSRTSPPRREALPEGIRLGGVLPVQRRSGEGRGPRGLVPDDHLLGRR